MNLFVGGRGGRYNDGPYNCNDGKNLTKCAFYLYRQDLTSNFSKAMEVVLVDTTMVETVATTRATIREVVAVAMGMAMTTMVMV